MNRKYEVSLTVDEQNYLQEIINDKTSSRTKKNRAKILIMLDERVGKPAKQKEIAKRCGVSVVTIFNTIKEFNLSGLESTLTLKRKNVPNPPIVTGEHEARIIALACGEPPSGFSRWTVRLLSEKIVELNIMEHISHETVRQTLKKQNLSLI